MCKGLLSGSLQAACLPASPLLSCTQPLPSGATPRQRSAPWALPQRLPSCATRLHVLVSQAVGRPLVEGHAGLGQLGQALQDGAPVEE